MSVKPHRTLRSMLVHPKDKTKETEKCEVVYEIGCLNCEDVYIGETEGKFDIRLKEHMKDVESNKKTNYTRSERKSSLTTFNKSAITDHVIQNNHIIDWNRVKVIDREGDTRTGQVKEAIHIKRRSSTMKGTRGPTSYRGPTTLFSPLTSAAGEIADLTEGSQFGARKKDEVSSEIISGKYQFLLEKKIFFHN